MTATDELILRASKTVTTLQLKASLMLVALELIARKNTEEGELAKDVLKAITADEVREGVGKDGQ